MTTFGLNINLLNVYTGYILYFLDIKTWKFNENLLMYYNDVEKSLKSLFKIYRYIFFFFYSIYPLIIRNPGRTITRGTKYVHFFLSIIL